MTTASTSISPVHKPCKLTLWCWIIGQSDSLCRVDINEDRTVGHLKGAIVQKNPVIFEDVDACELDLWKASLPIDTQLENHVGNLQFLKYDVLWVVDQLEEIFPLPEPVKMQLHIFVRHPRPPKRPRLEGQGPFSGSPNPPIWNLSDDPNSPLQRFQINDVIADFLSECRPRMRQLVRMAKIFANATLKHHVSELHIPAVHGRPSLLLQNLGEEKTKNRMSWIPDIFLKGQHLILDNTSGSGKTRLLLDDLCQRWSYYFAADDSGIGSEDFRGIFYDHCAKTMNIEHTQETASRALTRVLFSRLLLLGLLVEEVQAVEEQSRLPWLQYRRLWVLLQVQPVEIFGWDLCLELAICLRAAELRGSDASSASVTVRNP